MTGMTDFFTRETANEGLKVPLFLPDGRDSGHWLQIRGMESDEYRKANTESQRELMLKKVGEMSAAQRAAFLEESERKLIASLVISWSLPEKMTKPNLLKFLKEAPQIADQIDRVASDRRLFHSKKSISSSSSQTTSSSKRKK